MCTEGLVLDVGLVRASSIDYINQKISLRICRICDVNLRILRGRLGKTTDILEHKSQNISKLILFARDILYKRQIQQNVCYSDGRKNITPQVLSIVGNDKNLGKASIFQENYQIGKLADTSRLKYDGFKVLLIYFSHFLYQSIIKIGARRIISWIVLSVSLNEKEVIVITGSYEDQEKYQEKKRKTLPSFNRQEHGSKEYNL